jgi:uncharacterized ferritin-like protein (DUF455 family)
MMAQETLKTQVLVEPQVWRKLAALDETLHALLRGGVTEVPVTPGRDVQILPIRELPAKKGFASREGQARLLHDLASIELQAMELGLRTLAEFPLSPQGFRSELAAVTADEGRHLKLCLEGLESLGLPWGSFPTHTALWQATAADDSLLDRIVMVHRFLEGSGLDASTTLLRRLAGVKAPETLRAVEVIGRDEVGHVRFGSRWYHRLVKESGVPAEVDFRARLERLFARVPRRLEPIQKDLRLSVGFTTSEIEYLEELRVRRSNQSSHPNAEIATDPRPVCRE